MPRGDQTGPRGMGPMTGRAAGFCAGYNTPGSANPAPGTRCGLGMGRGRGFRGGGGFGGRGIRGGGLGGFSYGWHPELEKQSLMQHSEALQKQAEQLQTELEAVRNRIQELTRGTPED